MASINKKGKAFKNTLRPFGLSVDKINDEFTVETRNLIKNMLFI